MLEIKPPAPFIDIINQRLHARNSIFLGGSIEMGAAKDWQKQVVAWMKDEPWVILNPRRDDWDASWVQSKDNPQFREQVEWELQAQYSTDYVFFYFDPLTKSPITLMELGLLAGSDWNYKAIVCCPDGYWRKGNVDIVCDFYGIQTIPKLEDLPDYLRADVRGEES